MTKDIAGLRDALMDLTGVLNHPGPDEALLATAGIALERALFPLLVRIARLGPLGVVELADLAGRDYTTVSRQLARLEELGLVERRPGAADKRVREAVVTTAGRALVGRIDTAREKIMGGMLADWSDAEFATLVKLLRRLADAALTRLE